MNMQKVYTQIFSTLEVHWKNSFNISADVTRQVVS